MGHQGVQHFEISTELPPPDDLFTVKIHSISSPSSVFNSDSRLLSTRGYSKKCPAKSTIFESRFFWLLLPDIALDSLSSDGDGMARPCQNEFHFFPESSHPHQEGWHIHRFTLDMPRVHPSMPSQPISLQWPPSNNVDSHNE